RNEGSLRIDNSTVVGNGGGIQSAGTTRLRNSIVVDNMNIPPQKDVDGPFISEGYNLIGTTAGSTGFPGTGDLLGITAAQISLQPLGDFGGPTLTLYPNAGSIALDRGNRGVDENGDPIDGDQRG